MNDPYKEIIDIIRKKTSVNGCEVCKDRIVRIKTDNAITNEYLGFDGDEKSVPYKEFLNLIHYQTSDDYMERSAEIKYMHDMYGKT